MFLSDFQFGTQVVKFHGGPGDEGVPEGADGEGKQPRVYSPIQQQRRSNLAIKEGGEERPLKEVNPSLEPQTARVVKVNRQKGTEVFW